MSKRARLAAEYEASQNIVPVAPSRSTSVFPELQQTVQDYGLQLRHHLFKMHCLGGDKMPSSELVRIADLHTKSGGVGLEDLAMEAGTERNANRKVEKAIAKTWQHPQLTYTDVPLHDTQSNIRIQTTTGMRMPSTSLLTDHDCTDADFQTMSDELCESYLEHDVTREKLGAGVNGRCIAAMSLYWDAVEYANKDSFVGFFFQNMMTRRKYLCCALRDNPSCSNACFMSLSGAGGL